jgi:hypothetical protein
METKLFWDTLAEKLDLPFDIEDVTAIEENPGGTHIETTKGTFFIMVEECEVEAEFFVQDKTGRGFNNTLSKKDLTEDEDAWEDETSWNEDITASDWAKSAEVGDIFENETIKITRTK